MDDIVKAALVKWPNVPHCYGWLALDARGDWYMRDDRVQAAGAFPHPKGSRILHDKLRAFIERNYASDERGCWFFQNGPQRVYVELEAAPYVWRLQRDESSDENGSATSDATMSASAFDETGASVRALAITSHTGLDASFETCWLDDLGRLFIGTDLGFGLVHTLDMHLAADAIEQGRWQPNEMTFDAMPARFAYRLKPLSPG